MTRDILWSTEVVTLDKLFVFIGLLVASLLTSCGVKDIARAFNAEHANRLLSGDSTKSWALDSRIANQLEVIDPCLVDNQIVFVNAAEEDSLYIMGRPSNCESSDELDTLYKALYELEIDQEEDTQRIILTDERKASIGTITVDALTSTELRLNYVIDGVETVENYIQ